MRSKANVNEHSDIAQQLETLITPGPTPQTQHTASAPLSLSAPVSLPATTTNLNGNASQAFSERQNGNNNMDDLLTMNGLDQDFDITDWTADLQAFDASLLSYMDLTGDCTGL